MKSTSVTHDKLAATRILSARRHSAALGIGQPAARFVLGANRCAPSGKYTIFPVDRAPGVFDLDLVAGQHGPLDRRPPHAQRRRLAKQDRFQPVRIGRPRLHARASTPGRPFFI